MRSAKQKDHGACFPQSLARQQIEIYTRRGDVVLDPFVGVGTTMDACAETERRGIGVDLNEAFITEARRSLVSDADHRLIVGDSRRLDEWVAPESVDFVLTSPPYGSLLKNVKGAFAYKWREHSSIDLIDNPTPYSDRPEDLGNMEYVEFLEAIGTTFRQTFSALKPNSYAVWIVKDFRATKEGIPYVNLHGDVITEAERADFQLWDIRIYNQTRYRPLVCLGYPSRNFYLNIGHSYILVFKKP